MPRGVGRKPRFATAARLASLALLTAIGTALVVGASLVGAYAVLTRLAG